MTPYIHLSRVLNLLVNLIHFCITSWFRTVNYSPQSDLHPCSFLRNGQGQKNTTDECYSFLNQIGFNFLTVIMCTICCVCMKYGVSKEERHNGYQFFIKSQFHFFKTINTHFNLTQSKWIMGNIFGLKFHLSYTYALCKDFFF